MSQMICLVDFPTNNDIIVHVLNFAVNNLLGIHFLPSIPSC